MILKSEEVIRLQDVARQAYYNPRWKQDFELYWKETIIYRMDLPIPFDGYWEAVKSVKKAAWIDEACKQLPI